LGGTTFHTCADGTDVASAFRDAVEQAQYDFGHAGYTGTIAEKHDYVVIEPTPITEQAAADLAQRLIRECDDRIDDKWGPAGAIAIAGGERTLRVQIPARPGGYPTLREAAEAALPNLPEGQSIVGVNGYGYDKTAQGRPCRGSIDVTLSGGTEHTGWLFFGWASC
jgi:hypothetical protein